MNRTRPLALEHALVEYCAPIGSDEGRALKVEQEAQVWLCAAEHYRDFLMVIVGDAVASYRRKPGLDGLTRIYNKTLAP